MASNLKIYIYAATILGMSLFIRFEGLDGWSFSGDEVATILELEKSFDIQAEGNDQVYKLPKLIPIGYFVINFGKTIFGDNEFGYRAFSAIFGALKRNVHFYIFGSSNRSSDRCCNFIVSCIMAGAYFSFPTSKILYYRRFFLKFSYIIWSSVSKK